MGKGYISAHPRLQRMGFLARSAPTKCVTSISDHSKLTCVWVARRAHGIVCVKKKSHLSAHSLGIITPSVVEAKVKEELQFPRSKGMLTSVIWHPLPAARSWNHNICVDTGACGLRFQLVRSLAFMDGFAHKGWSESGSRKPRREGF